MSVWDSRRWKFRFPDLRRACLAALAAAAWPAIAADTASSPPPRTAFPDFSAEIAANRSYWIPAAEIVAFDFLLNRFDQAYFGCCDFDVTARTIRRNLRSSWVIDRDPFLVNQLGHPYQGSMYHGFARASGLGYWEGLGYTFLGSAFWEVFGETTPPSRNDQVNTGIGGSFLGEALFRMSNLVLENKDLAPWVRELAAAAISPPVGFNRKVFGNRFDKVFPSRGPIYFSRLQLGFSGQAAASGGTSTTGLKANEALADYFMEYGLPGKKDYDYSRPFDYFTFQATASSANGFENVMTRGLLIGRDYTVGKEQRGFLGLYGNYDYIAPQTFRMSTTGLSLGATTQWRLSRDYELLTSLMAGLGYTAAGTIRSTAENDFSYGVAPQAFASARLIFREAMALDVTAREHFITRVGARAGGGRENIARIDAALTWRIHKQHGISVKYLGNRRDVRGGDLGDRVQRRSTIGLFYTLLGHDRFGAAAW